MKGVFAYFWNVEREFTIAALLFITIIFIPALVMNFNDHSYVVTVTNKERIINVEDEKLSSYYLVFCKDQAGNFHEFKIEDLFIRGKFLSSRTYNQLEIGQTYELTVVGFRCGFFSMYENIISVKKAVSL